MIDVDDRQRNAGEEVPPGVLPLRDRSKDKALAATVVLVDAVNGELITLLIINVSNCENEKV